MGAIGDANPLFLQASRLAVNRAKPPSRRKAVTPARQAQAFLAGLAGMREERASY